MSSNTPHRRLFEDKTTTANATLTGTFGWKDWLFVAVLVAAVFLAYQPSWHGVFLWDDNVHVTPPELRSWHGLYRIWFEIGSLDRYYPLLDSVFWCQHQLWGDTTFGYHLVTITLHVMAVILVWLILRRLKVPGAYLAAAIFALHPVMVESVAWIAETKNTLSAVFFFGALLLYLRFDLTGKMPWYLGALGVFVLALLSKTTSVVLPPVLLVMVWWLRGRLSWKKDLLPLIPFFLLSALAGMLAIWIERNVVGAVGKEFNFTMVERGLIAGRAIWFYLGKLCWPANLFTIYPRWQVSQGVWWQYLFPAATLLLLAAVWRLRRWGRGPLAGLLFFVITLFPLLGVVDLNYLRYSFVADHFQYLASPGIITLFSAGIALLLNRAKDFGKMIGQTGCVVLATLLAVLSWQQSRIYADAETFYRTTVDRNHDCWVAQDNLGVALMERGRMDEAIVHYQTALKINPDFVDAHNNLGIALLYREQVGEAIAHFQAALKINPNYLKAHFNLGKVLLQRGQVDEAIAHYRTALKIKPDQAEAHCILGVILMERGQMDEAILHYRTALKIKPDYTEAHINFGNALTQQGKFAEAIAQFEMARRLRAELDADSHYSWGVSLLSLSRQADAIVHFRKAIDLDPRFAEAHNNLGAALLMRGDRKEAERHFREALRLKPDFADASENLRNTLSP